eukprot:TCONS_00067840-protein
MPITPEDFICYLSILSDEINLKVGIPQHFKGGIITGTSATVGGFCGGPLGVLMGGAFGGTLAAISCKDQQKYVKDVLLTLKRDERYCIYEYFKTNLLEHEFGKCKSYSELSSRLERDLDLKHDVIRVLKEFVVGQWKVQIIDERLGHHK